MVIDGNVIGGFGCGLRVWFWVFLQVAEEWVDEIGDEVGDFVWDDSVKPWFCELVEW
jgi:hypothetical protein